MNFTVPAGVTHEIYAWTLSGNPGPFTLPTLPTGMTVATQIPANLAYHSPFAGMAIGSLAQGSYTASISYGSWVNSVTVVVYGISNDTGYGYEFESQWEAASIHMPSGAAIYLGIETTGTTNPLTNASLTTLDEHTAAETGGVGALIGRQSSNDLSFQPSSASGDYYGIVGAGIARGTPVTFQETGLPAIANWSVAMNGSTLTAANQSTQTFVLPNGTYPYAVGTSGCYRPTPSSGNVTVNGAASVVNVTYALAGCYPVVFNETGLPLGQPWRVFVGTATAGISNNSSLAFRLPSGIYSFSVSTPLACYTATPSSGTLLVNGTAVYENVVFASDCYRVTFNETGLPVGTLWAATLSNNGVATSNSPSLSFSVPNGAYAFSVAPVECSWLATPSHGTLVMNGSAIEVGISFALQAGSVVTYPPTIRILGCLTASPENFVPPFTLNFTVPVGVTHEIYAWTLSGNFSSFVAPTLPPGLTVKTEVPYNLSSRGPFLGMAFGALAPGTYSSTLSYSGFVNVVSVVVYGISNDSGFGYEFAAGAQTTSLTLPTGASVYLGVETSGGTLGLTGPSLTTVDEHATPLQGGETALIGRQSSNSFSFQTTAHSKGIVAVAIARGTPVTFQETGVKPGLPWSVTANGSTLTATNQSTITFLLPNGTYPFTMGGATCSYGPSPASGTVAVNGTALNVNIAYTAAGAPACFPVEFLARGLPSYDTWSVYVPSLGVGMSNFTGVTGRGTITVQAPAGLLSFAIKAPLNYGLARISGMGSPTRTNDTVAGPTQIVARFGEMETVAFRESSLAEFELYAGASWSVSLVPVPRDVGPLAQTNTTTGNGVGFRVPVNASYRFVVTAPSEYKIPGAEGRIHVTALTLVRTVKFKLLTEKIVWKPFQGLAGDSWTVTILNGTTPVFSFPLSETKAFGKGAIIFRLPVGNYSYEITTSGPQTPKPSTGTVAVTSAPAPAQVVQVTFS